MRVKTLEKQLTEFIGDQQCLPILYQHVYVYVCGRVCVCVCVISLTTD